MQYCSKCKIKIRGNKVCCPLCQGSLSGEPESGAFPVLPEPRVSRISFFRIVTFLVLAVEIGFFITGYITGLAWTYLVMASVLLGWADLWVALYYRHKVIKLINFQTYLIMLVVLGVVYYTHFSFWATVWFYPAAFLGLAVTTIVIGRAERLAFEYYVVYLLWNIVFSFLQLIPILRGRNPLPLPACISMGLLFLLGAAALLFRPRELRRASGKWFNL